MTLAKELEDQLRARGLVPGTPEWDLQERRMKAEACRERRGVESCGECPDSHACTFAMQLIQDLRNA